ncbi:hypothetical protein HS5_15090 [Acidianus sp. HS-5]|nr:hypothetical protein HS5_15090 [Acidianus sp. HS-5]
MSSNAKFLNVLLTKSKFDITIYGIETIFTFKSVNFTFIDKILSKLMRTYEIVNVQVDLQHVHLILENTNRRVYVTIGFY